MGLAALGSLASGLNQGLVQGQNRLDTLAERDRVAARQKRLDDRQDVVWGREDAAYNRGEEERQALEAANSAGAEVMKRYQDEWKKQQPGPTLDGGPVPVNPFKPTPMMALEAGRARTDKLLELKGPTETWMKAYAGDEAMRAQLRAQAGQRVKAALVGGQDPSESLTEFFGTMNDGYSVTGVKPTRGLDGKTTLQIARVNRFTGQPAEPLVIPADQLARDIDMLSANPVDLAKHNMQMLLEAYKKDADIQREKVKGQEARDTERVKGEENRKTEGVKGAQERNKPYTLSDGQERYVDEPQPDGTLKPKKIAGNKKDAAAKATTASQINSMVINNYGVLDVGTGKQVGSATTQALSAAAERLMADNPEIGANEAIAAAAKDMGLNLVKK